MSKEHFNKLLFKKATKYIKSNPQKAKQELEEYLEKYPNDYYTWAIYVSALISIKEFKLAEKALNFIFDNIKKNNYTIHQHYFEDHFFEKDLFYVQAQLLSNTEKYQELYERFNQNKGVYESFRKLDFLKIYCEKKLGILTRKKEQTDAYIVRQIIDYDETDMRNHIKKHLSDYNNEQEEINDSIFNYDFPIDKMIQEVKKYIPSSKNILFGLYTDSYFFKYDYCGKNDGKQTNYFVVVCIKNTNNIITMCPSLIGEELPHIDLNYLNQKEIKVKKISQIDRFNKRYKM